MGAALLSGRNASEGGEEGRGGAAVTRDGRTGEAARGGTAPGGEGKAAGVEDGRVGGASSWNWEREAGRGACFDDFFETFAGGDVAGDWDGGGDGYREGAERPSTGGTAS